MSEQIECDYALRHSLVLLVFVLAFSFPLGIGPCYTTKMSRSGVRVGELVDDWDAFTHRFKAVCSLL